MVNEDISDPVDLNRYNKSIPDICTKCQEFEVVYGNAGKSKPSGKR
jgi:hypothetical protein